MTRETYFKRCTVCSGTGYHIKTNATTGNVYREECSPCGGRGGSDVPVGK